jgi:hemolysin activation/secretion protein
MRFNKKILIIFSICFMFLNFKIYALTDVERTALENQQIITMKNQLEEERKQMQRKQKEIEKEMKRLEDEKLKEQQRTEDEKNTKYKIFVKKIIFSGNTKIKSKKIQKIIRTFENKELSKNDLKELQNKITSLYFDKGYVSSNPAIDFSEIDNEILMINIVEGKIDNFEFDSQKKNNKKSELFMAFPLLKNEILNIRDIEQGLEQINRLKSNNATMNILPSEKEGKLIVSIINNQSKKNEIFLGLNNNGTEDNRYKATTGLDFDNIFHLNDNICFDYSRGYKDNEDFYNRNYSASLGIPFGYWNIDASYNNSTYLITKSNVKSNGETFNTKITIKRMLFRNKIYKLNSGTSLEQKNTKNYMNNEKLYYGSRILTPMELFLENTFYLNKGAMFFRFSYYEGLDFWDAQKDDEYVKPQDPLAQYKKIGLSGYCNKNFSFLNYMLSFRGQYSYDNLFGSEQFSPNVRSFKDGCPSSDSGFNLNNEFKVKIINIMPFFKNNILNYILYNTNLGIFYDYGKIYAKSVDPTEEMSGY